MKRVKGEAGSLRYEYLPRYGTPEIPWKVNAFVTCWHLPDLQGSFFNSKIRRNLNNLISTTRLFLEARFPDTLIDHASR